MSEHQGKALRYVVTATLPSQEVFEAYVKWLTDEGHAQAVIDGGASNAEVIVLDGDGFRVQTSYTFADREAYAGYEATAAPALRADGVARFGGVAGVAFSRTLGPVVFSLGGA